MLARVIKDEEKTAIVRTIRILAFQGTGIRNKNMTTPKNSPVWQQPKSEIDALEMQLGQIAGAWRETEDSVYIKQYHDIYHKLVSLGWDGRIDVEAELPYDLTPQIYVDDIRAVQARSHSTRS